MTNYRKMYSILCCAASEAIDFLLQNDTERAIGHLQNGLDSAEEIYIQQLPPNAENHRVRNAVSSWFVKYGPKLTYFLVTILIILCVFCAGIVFGIHSGYLR